VHRIPVGVLGASGYAGRELCAIISRHPGLELTFATANAQRGERLRLGNGREITFIATDDAPLRDSALVFSALPHGASGEWVERVLADGARAIDLSTDLRPGNGATREAPYGLTEVTRDAVRGAQAVANPGCYPTSILLAILPLIARGLVAPGATINAVAASGVTGAGLTPRLDLLFGEVSEDFRAYGIGNQHRHLNEMRAVLAAAGTDADLLFTPHLLPVARGILATITVPLTTTLDDPNAIWRAQYAGEPFIEIADEPPSLRDVVRRNVVRIHARHAAHVRTPTLQVFSAIDNLVKGAAGQAVQNANLALGLDETMGLPA
jgi:N-acetyl-gamma-glutamyl-phosphate reductase